MGPSEFERRLKELADLWHLRITDMPTIGEEGRRLLEQAHHELIAELSLEAVRRETLTRRRHHAHGGRRPR